MTFLNAQNNVGIGNSSPAVSAILDLTNAQNKGLLIPSMTTSQKNSMVSPANGLLIYQIDSTLGFYFFDGTKWRITGGGGNAWIETDSAVYTNKSVGIGTTDPKHTLEAHGNILVTANSISTSTPPTITNPGQTKNMVNGIPITYASTDSTGRFYDTGGPNGNYFGAGIGSMNSFTSLCTINNSPSFTGIELIFESVDIGLGDSLVIRTSVSGDVLLAVGNGYHTAKRYVFNSNSLYIRFKSNDDGVVGAGFSILFKRLFQDPGQKGISNFSGNTFYFDSKNGSVLAGMMSNVTQGNFSSAFGYLAEAGGSYALSSGYYCRANADYATAIGKNCQANGSQSIALGSSATANAEGAISVGDGTHADGNHSIAMGEDVDALGDNAIAIGEDVEANDKHAVAIGYNAVADGEGATAMGSNTIADGLNSTAFGNTTQASATTSTAMGNSTLASGVTSTAMGYSTEANGNRSTSLGSYTQSNGYGCTALGLYNDPIVSPQSSSDPSTPLFIIGNGDLGGTRTNAMIVRKDGHIGIGTNTPHVRLQISNGVDADLGDEAGYVVIGSVAGPNIVMDNNEILARDNATASDIYLQKTGGKVFIGSATSPNFLLSVNGTAGKNGGGNWSTYSDMRLKQNIHSYSEGLDALLKINPVWFQYNSISGYDTKPEYVGVLAQELKEIAPYMVTPSEKKLEDGSPGYLTVDNSAMTYMLINAVKELNQKIEILERKCGNK